MSTTSNDVVEVETSAWRTLAIALGSVVMTALSAVVALNLFPDTNLGIVPRAIGAFGTLFFALCTGLWLARLVGRRAVLTISPQGIRDRRVARESIPWSAIRRISTWEYSGQRTMVLDVDPAVEQKLHLSRIARWTRGANRKLGVDGLCIATQGLKISYDELFELVRRYLNNDAFRRGASGSHSA